MIWNLPPVELLPSAKAAINDHAKLKRIGGELTEKLDSLGVRCEVERMIIGPQVTRYEMIPSEGMSIRKIPAMAPDLAFEIAAEKVNVIAPIPGKRAIGVEIPTPSRQIVNLRDVLDVSEAPLTFALGLDSEGREIAVDLADAPHLLVAGMTGAGKSTMLNSMLVSLLMKATPDELGIVLIDPKRVEFAPFENIPHLMMPVVKDSNLAAHTLDWLVEEMESRYIFCEQHSVRNLDELNDKLPEDDRFPSILCVVDELADLMMVARKSVEASVIRLAQKARAVGIHLVLATQSPRVGVITGMIKTNMPSRIAFTTAQMIDSRVIMDRGGAENLLNNGDGLYLAGDAGVATRFQGAFTTIADVENVCDYWRAQVYRTEEVAA